MQQSQGTVSSGISQPGDAHELQAEAVQSAVVSGGAAQMQAVPAAPAVMPSVQRDDADDSAPSGILGKFLNFISDKVSLIPGFRLFTLIIGVNPITMSSVDRSPANLIRALVEIAPGGALITQALDNYGVIDKVGAFVTQQLQTLGLAADSILQAIKKFGSSLGLSDLLHLGALWDRAKAIFTEPVDRIKNFVVGLVTGILGLIKDAILMPLAKLAEGTRGWDLLIAVLGKNPITGDPVPRTAETLIGGFMKLIGEEETWNNIKKANALPRAWAWFQGALAGLLGFVTQIPTLFINTLKSLTLEDVVIITNAFAKVATVFGNFIGSFIKWAGDALWQLLQIIFEVLAPAAIPYLKKVGGAFKTILKNPIAFVGNLVAAGKLGFQQFASNIGTHLKDSFIQWLTGNLEGVYIPKSLDISEIVKFVLSVLGISWQNIRQKLVKVVGEPAVKAMETGFELVVTLVTKGPAAAWEQIKEQLSDLKDMVMQGIISFLTETVVKKAVEKVIGMLIPGAAFIEAIISIYNTVEVFLQKLQKIIQVAVAFLDSMMEIASGAIGNAANKVENTLAGLLTLAISFLAGFLGLGDLAAKVMDIINTKVRQPIDKALDKVIDWIVTMAKKLFAKAFGKEDKKDEKDERSSEQKQADLAKAMTEAQALQEDQEKTDEQVKQGLLTIKQTYKMTSLELIVDNEAGSEETVHIEGVINPPGATPQTKRKKGARPPELKGKATPTLDELETHEAGVSFRYVVDYAKYTGKKYSEIVAYVEERAARKLGRIKEAPGLAAYSAAGGATSSKNAKTIEILRVRGTGYSVDRQRIPDIFVLGAVVGDVKDVKEQSLDAQMQDDARIAKNDRVRIQGADNLITSPCKFDLVVRAPKDGQEEGTHVSGPLQAEVAKSGGDIYEVL